MTQRPQEPAEVPSDAPVSPGRPARVPALASAALAVVFALLGFMGAVPATDLAGALVLGGGLLAGAAALPRAGRVLAPAAVAASVGVVGLLQAVVVSRGGGGLLIAASAVAVLTWVATVVAALMDAGVFGSRAPRAAVASAPQATPAPAPAWAPVEGWQPNAYPADPTMTYVGRQPTGQQAFGPSVGGQAGGGQPVPAGAPDPTAVFGQPGQAGVPDSTAVFGQPGQAGVPDSTAVFARSAQVGEPEPTAVFSGVSQPGAPEPAAALGQQPPVGGPEPTAVFGQPPQGPTAGLSPQSGAPESTPAHPGAAAPVYGLSGGQPPTGTHRAPTQDGGPLSGTLPTRDGFSATGPRSVAEATPFGAEAQPPGSRPDVPLFGAPGVGQPAQEASPFGTTAASPEAPAFGLAGTGQATSSAHHEPVQDASGIDRAPGGDRPLFGVSGVGQSSSAHHEPVQDASAYDRAHPRPVYGAASNERGHDAGAGRPPTGAHRAPTQDGVPLFGAPPPAGQPGRNGAHPAPGGPVYGLSAGAARSGRGPNSPTRQGGSDPQGHGLFGASTSNSAPMGAHRTPAEAGSPSNGRTEPDAGRGESSPHRAPTSGADASAPSYGPNGASRGGGGEVTTNGASREGAVPSQRAGTEASGPSYQQAVGRARRRAAGGEGSSSPFGPPSSGAATGGDTPHPAYGQSGSAGREAPGARSAEQRPADQGNGDADPSPETTAFPVQHAPTGDPAPAWGQAPPAGQDATMVAAPGWLGAAQSGSDTAGPPRRAARDGRHGTPDEGRHGQPDPGRPDAPRGYPKPER